MDCDLFSETANVTIIIYIDVVISRYKGYILQTSSVDTRPLPAQLTEAA